MLKCKGAKAVRTRSIQSEMPEIKQEVEALGQQWETETKKLNVFDGANAICIGATFSTIPTASKKHYAQLNNRDTETITSLYTYSTSPHTSPFHHHHPYTPTKPQI